MRITVIITLILSFLMAGPSRGQSTNAPKDLVPPSSNAGPMTAEQAEFLKANKFDFLFHHLENMTTIGDDLDRQKKDSEMWRSFEQKDSGLTPEEWEFVRSRALACRGEQRGFEAAMNDAGVRRQAAISVGASTDEFDAKIRDARSEYHKAVEKARQNIEVRLGSERYSLLLQYMERRFQVRVIPATGQNPQVRTGDSGGASR